MDTTRRAMLAGGAAAAAAFTSTDASTQISGPIVQTGREEQLPPLDGGHALK
jgi:hypothetical protein